VNVISRSQGILERASGKWFVVDDQYPHNLSLH